MNSARFRCQWGGGASKPRDRAHVVPRRVDGLTGSQLRHHRWRTVPDALVKHLNHRTIIQIQQIARIKGGDPVAIHILPIGAKGPKTAAECAVDRPVFAPAFADWRFDWIDVPTLIAGAEQVLEYPMVDRKPLARWTDGRITLIGDAAHPTYPVGSNGASQAIIDARVLAACLHDHGPTPDALQDYEAKIRPLTTNNPARRTRRACREVQAPRRLYRRAGQCPPLATAWLSGADYRAPPLIMPPTFARVAAWWAWVIATARASAASTDVVIAVAAPGNSRATMACI